MVLDNGSFDIRCRSWKKWKVHKVIYYKDDIAFKYSYDSNNISIRKATFNDSGSYHCTGYLNKVECKSDKFSIAVVKGKLIKEKKIVHGRGRESGLMSQCLKLVQQGHRDCLERLTNL